MTKRAVLIGCNYPGTKAKLNGCINDVRRMHRCLLDRYGFPAEHIVVLIDTEGSANAQPTGKNIRAALSNMVASAKAGDILFVHYSGHGVRLPADDDDTGYDECIVPTDMNLITDDDFRELVNKVAKGCRITIVSDSCHSGGLIDKAKEQIGESTRPNWKAQVTNVEKPPPGSLKNLLDAAAPKVKKLMKKVKRKFLGQEVEHLVTPKSLPLSTLIEILKQKTGKLNIGVGELRPTLFAMFRDDSTPKVKKIMTAVMWKFLGRGTDGGILISGSQSGEEAAEVTPDGDGSRAYGALSNAIQEIIAEMGGEMSNRELVVRARELLMRQGFTQHPGLYCTDLHLHDRFIC
ncbi:metacaspase-4-like [Salvia miltiorrhiza]|uniref:metacaspase-4-like n=1 Tax=Salvia miltiorrhiza TaxID=226208 RepID=UPI0025AC7754|nr:metacaspase-4-like [Salvia miltiorrhiza]XP_057795089.1 metacaspase-4-like [Salvia miltiorrhiza]